MDEASLIRRAASGEAAAFDALVERHAAAVLGVARARTGDPALAEEILQEAFVRMFKHLRRFRGESSLRTWLVRVSLNLATDAARRDPRRFESFAEPFPEPASLVDDAEQAGMRTEEAARVRGALSRLPEPLRVTVSLRYDADMSYAEIARELNIPIGTVSSRLAHALMLLRATLAPAETDKQRG
jgi:RNA polymerase sigma-70 factor, ECF subfamily